MAHFNGAISNIKTLNKTMRFEQLRILKRKVERIREQNYK